MTVHGILALPARSYGITECPRAGNKNKQIHTAVKFLLVHYQYKWDELVWKFTVPAVVRLQEILCGK